MRTKMHLQHVTWHYAVVRRFTTHQDFITALRRQEITPRTLPPHPVFRHTLYVNKIQTTVEEFHDANGELWQHLLHFGPLARGQLCECVWPIIFYVSLHHVNMSWTSETSDTALRQRAKPKRFEILIKSTSLPFSPGHVELMLHSLYIFRWLSESCSWK